MSLVKALHTLSRKSPEFWTENGAAGHSEMLDGWLEKAELKPTQPSLAGAWLSLATTSRLKRTSTMKTTSKVYPLRRVIVGASTQARGFYGRVPKCPGNFVRVDICPGTLLSGWTDGRVDRCPGNFVRVYLFMLG